MDNALLLIVRRTISRVINKNGIGIFIEAMVMVG
jgi:hypothetical protein